ncbi:MAG: SDR family oxidoreductase [Acidimicrobiia bacterium]|jgi:NAD(P)-dependent dehydrogenase (short-subunit alcohol dehydrogenase family)
MGSLDGYSVLVTGGGTGIGQACAAALLADGAAVTICGRTAETLDAAAAALGVTPGGGSVAWVTADVTSEPDVEAAVAHAVAHGGGRLDGVVGNAGGSRHLGPIVLADVEAVRATLDLNIIGAFLSLKHSAPHLAESGRGSYVGISSHAGRDTFRFMGAYGAGKAGMDHLLRVAADELGGAGIRVNSVQPGVIATEIMGAITGGSPVLDSYLAEIPLKRVGEPEEIGALVRFLIGPESGYVTGQSISIDGGQSLRKGADYGAFAQAAYGTDPLWRLVAED